MTEMSRPSGFPWASSIAAGFGIIVWFIMFRRPFQSAALPHLLISITASAISVLASRAWSVRAAVIANAMLLLLVIGIAALMSGQLPAGYGLESAWKRVAVFAVQSAIPIATAFLSVLEIRRLHWHPAAEVAAAAFVAIAVLPFALIIGLFAFIMLGGSWP
jgi:hypothetical protein